MGNIQVNHLHTFCSDSFGTLGLFSLSLSLVLLLLRVIGRLVRVVRLVLTHWLLLLLLLLLRGE